jgi:hypothetical protein
MRATATAVLCMVRLLLLSRGLCVCVDNEAVRGVPNW